jgi:hypothetical protein
MSDNMQVLGREGSLSTTQNKVLRNTYALLGLTMIPTDCAAPIYGVWCVYISYYWHANGNYG